MERRIISLIASSTEIVCALGLEANLVGRSHECDFPESVNRLPACTAPKIDPRGASLAIDRSVKALLENSLSVYRVDAGLVRTLRPTHIITQAQCEVCAVSLRDVQGMLQEWTAAAGLRPEVISLEPNALADVWSDILRVAGALGVPERGHRLVEEMKARMGAIEGRTASLPRRQRVAAIEWIEPLMAAGNWMPELVAMAGGRNLFGEAGKHSPALRWEDLAAQDPDAIVVAPCGFDIPRTREEMKALAERPGWERLGAVEAGRVFLGDGNRFFNRPGPRLVESLEILAETLHPEEFRFGHEGRGWERFAGP